MSKIDEELGPNRAEDSLSLGEEGAGVEKCGGGDEHQSEHASGGEGNGSGERENSEAKSGAERQRWEEELQAEAERTHKLFRLAEEASSTLGARQRFDKAKAQGLRATAVCSIFSRQNEETHARLQIVRARGRRGVAPREGNGVGGADGAGLGDEEEETPPGFWGSYHHTRNNYLKGRESGHKMLFRKEWGVRQQRKKELWRMRREVRRGGRRGGEGGRERGGRGGRGEESMCIPFSRHS